MNSLASGASNVWSMGLALLSLPVMLHGLGRQAFGVWAIVSTFSATNGWLSLADLGVVVATTRRVSERAALDDGPGVRRIVGAALRLGTALGLLSGAALALASYGLSVLFHLPPSLVHACRIAFQLMAIQVVADLALNVVEGALEGLQRVDLSRGVDSVRRLAVVVAAAVAAEVTHDVRRVALASLVATAASLVIGAVVLASRLPRTPSAPSFADARDLLRVGREIAVLRPLGVLQRTMDRILVGLVVGPSGVALVEVATQLQAGADAVLGASTYSVVPAAAWLRARDDGDSLAELAERGTRYSLLATVPAAIAVATLAGPFVRLWLGTGYGQVPGLVAVAACCVLVNAPLAVGSQLLVGIGRARAVLRATVAAIVVNLVVSIVALETLGLVGVFVGTLVANVVLALALGPSVLEAAGIAAGDFVRRVVAPVVPAALAQLAVALVLVRLDRAPLVVLAVAGAASLAAFAACSVRGLLRDVQHAL